MNSNSFPQWWPNTYHHHVQSQIANSSSSNNNNNFNSSLIFQNTSNAGETLYSVALHQILDDNSNAEIVYDHDNFSNLTYLTAYSDYHDEHNIPTLTLLFIAILYGLVVFGGILGNATLLLTLCSASSVRPRNPLVLAVCIADLLVTGISAPVTLLNLALHRKTKTIPLIVCKVIAVLQATPVAASTMSFFLLSLDRYAIVKNPRLALLRQRRYLHTSLAIISYLASAIVSIPFLFVYEMLAKTVVETKTTSTTPSPSPSPSHWIDVPSVGISYCSVPAANSIFAAFILVHTFIVFVFPGLGVLLNHYGVRRKLCALSLTARAAHGELPLPMPILRRQTHMVIVTGIANAHQAGCAGTTDDTSNGGDIQMQNLNHRSAHTNRNVISSKNPISPRAMREIREHSQRQRTARPGRVVRRVATPGIPLLQNSTLRSRRHLANMLVGSALLFIICWAPHVFCIIYKVMGYSNYCPKSALYFSLLAGYLYSALSPIIYWVLNHNSLRQSPCAPIIRIRSLQKFLRTRFRSNPVPPAPSSTNEAQLGPFNPKLIKLTPKQYRAQASSHYLY